MYQTGDTSYLRLRLKYLQFTYILDSSVDIWISSAEEFWSFEFFSFSNSWGNKSAATWN